MSNFRLSSATFLIAAIVVMVLSGAYTYTQRYFLRFIPIPLDAADVVNKGNWFMPVSQKANPLGTIDLGNHDIQTEDGLRKTLNAIQEMSPFEAVNGRPTYDDISFDDWVRQLETKPIFCTDGSLLFILAAWQQGLQAREWHLLPPGWPPGQGHSVVEFFNPSVSAWQVVDAQHAAIVRDKNGDPVNMLTVIRAYRENRPSDITYDYGPYEKMMLNGARGASVEHYFFEAKLLRTPVLQLRTPTWMATTERMFGLSGHFTIGYPIMVDGWTHDSRVWLTKVSILLMLLSGGAAALSIVAFLRRRSRGRRSF